MATLDLLILLALAAGVVAGLRSGMIRQVLSFAGLIVAFLLAMQLMQTAGAMAVASLGIADEIAPLVGFVLVFLAVQLAVFVLGRLLEAVIGALKLGFFNRVLGGGVGAFKAAVSLSVLFLVLGSFQIPSEEARAESTLYAPVATVLPAAWDYVGEAFPHVDSLTTGVGEQIQEHLPAPGASPTDSGASEAPSVSRNP